VKQDFRDLEIWQGARELRNELFERCRRLPKEGQYRLGDQIIRAPRSVSANIAERYGRYHYQETIQFMRQARGSLYELIDHLDVAQSCGYLTREHMESLVERIEQLIRGINGYISYLRSRKQAET
jgi:four helix bundle protein